MKNLIGLDIGTSSVKGVLMTETGEVIAKAHEKFIYTEIPEKGIVENDAIQFVEACKKAIKTLATASKDGEISGICASSASGNLVVLDKELNPATPIINWQDKRVTTEAKEVLASIDTDFIYERVGWPFGFKGLPLAQLCYIKKNNPEILENAGMVAMSTEYLYYCLTGKWGISTSAGTPFFLIDQVKGEYIPEFLDVLGISEDKVPPVMPCGTILGNVKDDVAAEIAVSADVPVILGTFDHPSAARGVGVLKEGEMLLSCGTSWVGFFPVNSREKIVSAKTLIDPFLSVNGGPWATMTSLASLSAKIKVYVEKYIDDSDKAYTIFGELAAKSETGANGLKINPQDEPNDDEILKYPKEDIARAIMEGTVNLLKDRLAILKEQGISANSAVMVGGPSENPMWIKIIEEICGIPVKVIHGAVAGAVGAAVLAGIGIGLYKDEQHAQEVFQK